MILDGLVNLISGLGSDRDKARASHFVFDRLDDQQAGAMYMESWSARKAVDIPADDQTREWRVWESEQAEALYEAERALRVRSLVNWCLKMEAIYGGSAILIGVGDGDPAQPLDPTRIARGGLQYLAAFARPDLSAVRWDDDIASPAFGKPMIYAIQHARMSRHIEVHRSRLVIFDGRDAPWQWRENNDGWGSSVLQFVRQAITSAEATAASAATLVHEATLDVVKIPDLQTYLADAESERRLLRRFGLAMQGKSMIRTLILGGDETYDRKQTTFAGLRDMMDAQYQTVAAALDIPITRFMGRSPGGLNATGDSDVRNYYDMIRARQQTDLADTLRPLDEALKAHVGATDPATTYEWSPLWTSTPEEQAAIAKVHAEVDTAYYNMGLFPDDAWARVVRDRLIAAGTYPSLEQHVDEAELEFVRPAPALPSPGE